MSFFVAREFISGVICGGLESARRKVSVRGTRRSTKAFGDVGVDFFGRMTMISVRGNTTDV